MEALTLLVRLSHIKFCIDDAEQAPKFQLLTVRARARPSMLVVYIACCIDVGFGWYGALA
jgi:hypothetical protein